MCLVLQLLQSTKKKKASFSRSLESLGNLAESFKQFRGLEANLLVVISLLLPIASLLCVVLFERASHQTSRCPALICNTPTYVFKVRLGSLFLLESSCLFKLPKYVWKFRSRCLDNCCFEFFNGTTSQMVSKKIKNLSIHLAKARHSRTFMHF